MAEYPMTLTAASAGAKANKQIAAALAIEIPRNTHDVAAALEEVHAELIMAGIDDYGLEALKAYRKVGLYVIGEDGSGLDENGSVMFVPGLSITAHRNALNGGIGIDELRSNPSALADRQAADAARNEAARLLARASKIPVGRSSISEYEARVHVESVARQAERQAQRAPIMAEMEARDAAIILPRVIGAEYAAEIKAARDERQAQHANGQKIERVTIERDPAASAAALLLNTVRQAVKAYEAQTGLTNGPEMVAALYAPAL